MDTGSDRVAKFRGDRPRELGDLAANKKKKKHHEHFIRPPVTPYGRPKKQNLPMSSQCSMNRSHLGAQEICSIDLGNGRISLSYGLQIRDVA